MVRRNDAELDNECRVPKYFSLNATFVLHSLLRLLLEFSALLFQIISYNFARINLNIGI